MNSWDTGPYGEGHLRYKEGSKDLFVMNYRLLKPQGYNEGYSQGYPLIVLMHGAVERGNCYYENCFHSTWEYDPNLNSPKASTAADSKLLNNDYHMLIGAKAHLAARNLAGTRMPNDASLPQRGFPGFVLMAQMMNNWDSLSVQHMIRIVRLHVDKYNIDEDRIYIHGLSIGGFATYQAIKRAPWLFAAALPMSAVTEAAYIFKHNQQDKVAHIPLWIFQGGKDPKPSPAFTEAVVNKFKAIGTTPRYTKYDDLGHAVWDRAYAEADFFSWILSKNKSHLFILKGETKIVRANNLFPKLMLAEGFLAYQWEKDGQILGGANSNTLTVNAPGNYRARFSRASAAPAQNQWNEWSNLVTITEDQPPPVEEEEEEEEEPEEEEEQQEEEEEQQEEEQQEEEEEQQEEEQQEEEEQPEEEEIVTGAEEPLNDVTLRIFPNPTNDRSINLSFNRNVTAELDVKLSDRLGRELSTQTIRVDGASFVPVSFQDLAPGVYVIRIKRGEFERWQRVMVR
jgi:hypothetical protein